MYSLMHLKNTVSALFIHIPLACNCLSANEAILKTVSKKNHTNQQNNVLQNCVYSICFIENGPANFDSFVLTNACMGHRLLSSTASVQQSVDPIPVASCRLDACHTLLIFVMHDMISIF